jgi:hypothetical protein
MPSWCLTISAVEPPSVGFYRAMQRNGGAQGTIATHMMAPRQHRAPAPCFFVYTGAQATDRLYPHVTVMLETPLFQQAGMLFFRSSEFHVSTRADTKLFYATNAGGQFVEERGQSGLLGSAALKLMAASFIGALKADITRGITPEALDDGWAGLRSSGGLRPWEWDALQRQNLENDQARLRQVGPERDEAWAQQFEWPEGY